MSKFDPRRESWPTRILLVLGLLLALLVTVELVLLVAQGILGEWQPGRIGDALGDLCFVFLGFGYVYWRRRALDAEKPMAMVRDIRAHFDGKQSLADIERWREQQSKALGL